MKEKIITLWVWEPKVTITAESSHNTSFLSRSGSMQHCASFHQIGLSAYSWWLAGMHKCSSPDQLKRNMWAPRGVTTVLVSQSPQSMKDNIVFNVTASVEIWNNVAVLATVTMTNQLNLEYFCLKHICQNLSKNKLLGSSLECKYVAEVIQENIHVKCLDFHIPCWKNHRSPGLGGCFPVKGPRPQWCFHEHNGSSRLRSENRQKTREAISDRN